MPQNRTYTVYRFDELSESSQRNAIALLQESRKETINTQLEELFAHHLKEWGYPVDSIEFDLNFTPDDGLAFYGTCDHNVLSSRIYQEQPDIKLLVQLYVEEVSIVGYYKWGFTMTPELTLTPGDKLSEGGIETVEDYSKLIGKDARSCAQQLKEMGYAEIKAANDEEVIRKAIETNNWWFHADGRLA